MTEKSHTDTAAQGSPLADAIKVIRAEPCPFRDGTEMADGWAEALATFLNRLGDTNGTNELYANSSPAAKPPTAPVENRKGDQVHWLRVNDEPFEYAIQQGPNGDEFVKLLNGECLRRPLSCSSADSRRDEIVAGAFYKTRGDKNNLPHIVGPLEHDLNDGDAPWKARVYDQVWKWGYDGLANADGTPHNRDLVERVYRPAPMPDEPQTSSKTEADHG